MVGKPGNRGDKGGGDRAFTVERRVLREDQQNESHNLQTEAELGGTPVFKMLAEHPPSDDLQACLKYYIQLEDQLRRFAKLRNGSFQIMKRNWDKILPYIENSLEASRILFTLDKSYYLKKELDVRVWKYGIYQFITVLRSELATVSNATDHEGAKMLSATIRKGIFHFKTMINDIPKVLKLKLEPVFNRSSVIRGIARKDNPSCEEDLVYRLFIAVGDLYRYGFEMDKNYYNTKFAQDMYTCARFVDTEKSRAYNQLGLMAKSRGDAMGVIYNFTRAWHVANPTAGAREQLLFIYDDLYKMYTKNKMNFWYTMMKTADYDLSHTSRSLELWVSDPSKSKIIIPKEKRVPPLRGDHLDSFPDDSIFSRFNFIYGHFLGMLYTKIGTEALEHVGKEMLVYLEGILLVKNINNFNFLMEVIAMIVFLIDNLTPPPATKDNAPVVAHAEHLRNVAFSGALGISLIFVEKIVEIIQHLDWDNPLLVTCTGALHIFLRWLHKRQNFCKLLYKRSKELMKLNHKNYSIPKNLVKDIRDIFLSSLFRLYAEFSLRDRRHKLLLFPKLTKEPEGDCSLPLGILPEHLVLDGFSNIVLADDIITTTHCYYSSRFSQERAQNYYRLKSMTFVCSIIFGSLKSGTVVPVKSFEPLDHLFYADEFKTMLYIHDQIREGVVLEKDVPIKSRRRPDCNSARIIVRKPLQSIKKESQEILHPKVQLSSNPLFSTVGFEIWSRLATMGIKGELVVQPIRVVLDTNVLIRQLDWVERLMYLLHHPMIIPTTVILELKGLQKGARRGPPRSRHNIQLSIGEKQERMIDSMETAEQCSRALEFLDRHKKNFRVVTVFGKIIEMYSYVGQKVFDERFDSTVRNDEKILETCCQLEANDRKTRALDQPLRIYRNTILVTGDVSLRVRAMVQDIPTREIQPFTTWLEDAKAGIVRLTPKTRRKQMKYDSKSDHRISYR